MYLTALERVEQALALDPYHEGLYRLKMRIHYHAGEVRQALAAYHACERALAELGAHPRAETRSLFTQIRNGQLPAPPRQVPHNLPAPTYAFFGR